MMDDIDNAFYADRADKALERWESIMEADGVFKSDNDELAMFTSGDHNIITIGRKVSITELETTDTDHLMRIYLTDDELKTFTKLIVMHWLETIWRK